MYKPTVKLTCTQEQFEEIHREVHKVRPTSTTVKVDKQALINLLMDHSVLLQHVDYRGDF